MVISARDSPKDQRDAKLTTTRADPLIGTISFSLAQKLLQTELFVLDVHPFLFLEHCRDPPEFEIAPSRMAADVAPSASTRRRHFDVTVPFARPAPVFSDGLQDFRVLLAVKLGHVLSGCDSDQVAGAAAPCRKDLSADGGAPARRGTGDRFR
jgi:hypothetical protein